MEDNRKIANEELSGIFDADKISDLFIESSLKSSGTYAEIPAIEKSEQSSDTTIVNNNVSISMDSKNPARVIEREINNFLNTQTISDPLELKKNYTIDLKQDIANLMKETFSGSEYLMDQGVRIPEAIERQISSSTELQEIENIINETKNNFYNTSNLNIINEQTYRELAKAQFSPSLGNISFDSMNEMEQKMEQLKGFQENLESNIMGKLGSMDPQRAMSTDPEELMQEMISDLSETFETERDAVTAQISGNAATVTSERKNINVGSIKNSSIDYLLNKMNSPPIWRTVLG